MRKLFKLHIFAKVLIYKIFLLQKQTTRIMTRRVTVELKHICETVHEKAIKMARPGKVNAQRKVADNVKTKVSTKERVKSTAKPWLVKTNKGASFPPLPSRLVRSGSIEY